MSGGPDSLAVLLLASTAFPGQIQAATVDHQLRPEAADEADMVALLCAELDIPHQIIRVYLKPGNVQMRAREARYEALARWANDSELVAVATAHHADDQAETVLMRLNRGSGLAGLTGVRAETFLNITGDETLRVLRPVLSWRKAELEQVVSAAGMRPALDPSNENIDFDRVRIRKALGGADWLDPAALARSAQLLGEAQSFIDGALSQVWDASTGKTGDGYWYIPGDSRFENIEIVAMIIERLGGEPRRSEVGRAIERLNQTQNASLAGVLARPIEDELGIRWEFEREPLRTTG